MTWPNDLKPVEIEVTKPAPEFYIRTQITKNTKGYSYETTAAVKWQGTQQSGETMLRELLGRADTVCRAEIEQREILDILAQEDDER